MNSLRSLTEMILFSFSFIVGSGFWRSECSWTNLCWTWVSLIPIIIKLLHMDATVLCLCEGVHRRMSLISSSLFLQQISGNLLSIRVDFNSAVSILPLISRSLSLFHWNFKGTSYNYTFMFHSLFCSIAKSMYLSICHFCLVIRRNSQIR